MPSRSKHISMHHKFTKLLKMPIAIQSHRQYTAHFNGRLVLAKILMDFCQLDVKLSPEKCVGVKLTSWCEWWNMHLHKDWFTNHYFHQLLPYHMDVCKSEPCLPLVWLFHFQHLNSSTADLDSEGTLQLLDVYWWDECKRLTVSLCFHTCPPGIILQ